MLLVTGCGQGNTISQFTNIPLHSTVLTSPNLSIKSVKCSAHSMVLLLNNGQVYVRGETYMSETPNDSDQFLPLNIFNNEPIQWIACNGKTLVCSSCK